MIFINSKIFKALALLGIATSSSNIFANDIFEHFFTKHKSNIAISAGLTVATKLLFKTKNLDTGRAAFLLSLAASSLKNKGKLTEAIKTPFSNFEQKIPLAIEVITDVAVSTIVSLITAKVVSFTASENSQEKDLSKIKKKLKETNKILLALETKMQQ